MNTRKQDDRAMLLDASLDFIMNSPDDTFDAYLAETGINGAELENRTSRAIDCAMLRYRAMSEAANTLDSLPVPKQREIAAKLDIPRNVLSAFRERKVIVASIPRPFLTRLAEVLGSTFDALLGCLTLPPSGDLASSYKSDMKPRAHLQATFEQLLIDAQVPAEKRAELLREHG